MANRAGSDLRDLLALKDRFDEGADRKLELLGRLEKSSLLNVRQVMAFHEILCYWRAYPENKILWDTVERLIAGFGERSDVRRHRKGLEDTGVVGATLQFQFYWLMAIRLVARWPDRLSIVWKDFEDAPKLLEILHLLVPYSESPGIDSVAFSPREWIERLKGPGETDAGFLIRRFAAMPVPRPTREFLYEALDVPIRLASGPDTPARSRERWDPSPIVYQTKPLSRSRPSLRQVARSTKLRIRALSPRDGRKMIDLANDVMVSRHRDLLVFLHGDEKDVRMIEFDDGLQFACIGAKPERRLMLEAVYGFLTLKNGVPIGYVLNSALFGSCELAYNVFDTFRGAEAARIYGRFIATVHRLFGADSFTIDPYQLGHNNREGQKSGAWWFYYKLGFRSRNPEVRALVREELRRIKADRSYRTSPARIHRLAADNMFLSLGRPRDQVLGRVSLGEIGLRISQYLANRFGADREAGLAKCKNEVAKLLGVRDLGRLSPGERIAWERWSPLVLSIPDVERWSRPERKALADVIRAKGGRRESEFVLLFDRHRKLNRAVSELAREED